jgi:hypothetical protein
MKILIHKDKEYYQEYYLKLLKEKMIKFYSIMHKI